jgi:hypothetical protein
MTQRSEHGAFVRAQFAGEEDGPVDTAIARNVALNNALHAYDMASSARVMDVRAVGLQGWTHTLGGSTYRHVKTWGPFPLLVRADDTPVPLVVRVAGRGNNLGTGKIKLSLFSWPNPWPVGTTPPELDEDDPAAAHVDLATTTVGWHDLPRALRLRSSDTRPVTLNTQALDGSGVVGVRTALAQLSLSMVATDSLAAVFGVYAREFML